VTTTHRLLRPPPTGSCRRHAAANGTARSPALLQAVVLLLSVLVVNGIVRQAESTYLEGVLLIASYLIIAVAFSYRSVKPDFGMLLVR
jgi:hypothetical protein